MGLPIDLFTDYTLRTVALGAAALGITSGALGSFALLRRQSLLGDAISHAALPGVALAYLLTGSKAPLALIVGAAIAGWVGTLVVMSIVRNSRVKYDSALGIVLSVFFGFGLVLLTFIQGRPDAAQAGLDRFLFGQAAALRSATSSRSRCSERSPLQRRHSSGRNSSCSVSTPTSAPRSDCRCGSWTSS